MQNPAVFMTRGRKKRMMHNELLAACHAKDIPERCFPKRLQL